VPSRFAALCGLAAPVTFIVGVVLGDLAQPDAFSPADDDISDLGALTAARPWLYNQVGAQLTGLLVVCFALGLWRVLRPSVLGRLGAAALVAVGTGLVLEGFLRLDCRGIDTACENTSWHADAHRVESGVTAVALFAAPFLLAFAFRHLPAWRGLWLTSLLAMPAVVVGSVAGSALGEGAATRVGTIVWFAWLALVAARLLWIGQGRVAEAVA
jgi:hypothetical membrane protein